MKLKQYAQKLRSKLTEEIQDIIFPRSLRRYSTWRIREDNDNWQDLPGIANEKSLDFKDVPMYDYRTPYRDAHDKNIQLEYNYHRKVDKVEKDLDGYVQEYEQELSKIDTAKEDELTDFQKLQLLRKNNNKEDLKKEISKMKKYVVKQGEEDNEDLKETQVFSESLNLQKTTSWLANSQVQMYYHRRKRIDKLKEKGVEVKMGNPKKWEVLDESFSQQNQNQAQKNIYDKRYLNSQHSQEQSGDNEEYQNLEYPFKNKYIDQIIDIQQNGKTKFESN